MSPEMHLLDIPLDPGPYIQQLATQFPIASLFGAAVWYLIKANAKTNERLLSVFEAEVKACEARYTMVFNELINIKDAFCSGECGGKH